MSNRAILINVLLLLIGSTVQFLLFYHQVKGAYVLYAMSGFMVGWGGMNLILNSRHNQ